MAPHNADGLAWHARSPLWWLPQSRGAPQAKGTCCCRWHNHILLETQVQKNSPNPRVCDPETSPQLRKIHSNEKTSPPHSDSSISIKYASLRTQYCPIEKSSSGRKRNTWTHNLRMRFPKRKNKLSSTSDSKQMLGKPSATRVPMTSQLEKASLSTYVAILEAETRYRMLGIPPCTKFKRRQDLHELFTQLLQPMEMDPPREYMGPWWDHVIGRYSHALTATHCADRFDSPKSET